MSFFFNDTATTEIYTLSLHDALPISAASNERRLHFFFDELQRRASKQLDLLMKYIELSGCLGGRERSEEHTSELQSRQYLVCRLLLEKKKHSEQLCTSLITTYTLYIC